MFDQIKNASFTQKMQLLVPFHREILDSIKRDLKQEHLSRDKAAHKKHFGNRPLHRITLEEIATVYMPLLLQSEQVGEFISSRWIYRHMEIYEFFSRKLEHLDPDFEQLAELDSDFSHQLAEEASAEFGSKEVLIFCVLNSVILRKDDFQALYARAQEKTESSESASKGESEGEVRRLEQRYQRKMAGLERKWQSEVRALKAQVAHLSRKVAGEAASASAK